MRVVGSRKAERLPCDREGVNRLRKVSYRVQSAGSPGNLRGGNHRMQHRMDSVIAGLDPDLGEAFIKGVRGIGVKCIEGEVHEQEDQQGETPTPALRSSTTISHD